jgi:hypothetical protein
MKHTIQTFVLAGLLAAAPALAGEKSHSQQEKMAHCSHESKGLKGEERQKFMSGCLKGAASEKAPAARDVHHDAANQSGQQGRMKSCNEQAGKKDLHGDERRAFMSTCLKG